MYKLEIKLIFLSISYSLFAVIYWDLFIYVILLLRIPWTHFNNFFFFIIYFLFIRDACKKLIFKTNIVAVATSVGEILVIQSKCLILKNVLTLLRIIDMDL